MKASATPIALVLFTAALIYAGVSIYEDKSAVSMITLYGASGAPVARWIGKGRVKMTASGCSFTADDGREISIGGTYLVERQR